MPHGVIENRSLLADHFDHLSSLVSDDTTLEQATKNPKSLVMAGSIDHRLLTEQP